jgi:hypothetical protein
MNDVDAKFGGGYWVDLAGTVFYLQSGTIEVMTDFLS